MYLAFGVQNLYAEEGDEKSKTIASSTPENKKSIIKKKMNLGIVKNMMNILEYNYEII